MSPSARTRLGVPLILLVAGVTTALVSTAGQDSREPRDLANHHAHADAGLDSRNVAGLKPAWKIGTETYVTHRPLIEDGRVYFADWGGRVYAADLRSGKILWARDVETPLKERPWHGFAGTGALGDGLLFEASAEGNAFALDVRTGELRWKVRLAPGEPTAGNAGPLLYHEGLVYAGLCSAEELIQEKGFRPAFRGAVIALDAKTGKTAWTLRLAEPPANGVAVWGGFALDADTRTLFFTTGNNYTGAATDLADAVVAVDGRAGKVRWKRQITENDVWTMTDPKGPDYDFGTGPQLFEVQRNGTSLRLVGAGQKSGVYVALDRETGTPVWQAAVGYGELAGGILADASVADGRVLVWSNNSFNPYTRKPGDCPMSVKALDAATGATLWALPKPQPAGVTAAGFLSKDVYFVPSLDGQIRAYRAGDGRLLWMSPEEDASIGASIAAGGGVLCAGRGVPEMFGGKGKTGHGVWAYAPVTGSR
ncbi:MAG TPA: PQQ-binding-like beta-propeller repeat protein [Planctomycetota bacterium]